MNCMCLLLMLTQSRLMPDLDMIWETKPVITTTASSLATAPMVDLNITTIYRSSLIAVRGRDDENLLPCGFRAERIVYGRSVQNAVRPDSVSSVNKLYLVFCQLKTEG